MRDGGRQRRLRHALKILSVESFPQEGEAAEQAAA